MCFTHMYIYTYNCWKKSKLKSFFNNYSNHERMCVLITLCNVDKHSPFDIYIYIHLYMVKQAILVPFMDLTFLQHTFMHYATRMFNFIFLFKVPRSFRIDNKLALVPMRWMCLLQLPGRSFTHHRWSCGAACWCGSWASCWVLPIYKSS